MFVYRLKMLSGIALAVIAILSLPSNVYAASLNSNAPTVALTATLGESLTLSASVSAVNFTLTNGTTSTGDKAVPITTTWVLLPSRTSVKVYGFFANASQAMSDGYTAPDYIATTSILGQVTTGAPTSF